MGSTPHRSPRGKETRCERHRNEQQHYAPKCQQICGLHVEKHAGQKSRERKGRNYAGNHAASHQLHSLAEQQSEEFPALCTEGNSDAEFTCTLRNAIRRNTIDPDQRKRQRSHSEGTDQNQSEFPALHRKAHIGFERHDA